MRYVSLFSGIEAASCAWEPLGWEPVAFAEIETFPKAVLKHHYPNVPDLGDITKVDWREYRGAVDLVCGGSPCQAFSIAGLRQALDDPRGQLMFEYLRACHEIDPEWIVWENVPGVLSADGGRAFGSFLAAVAELWPDGGAAWRVLDSQFHGVAQRRERVFVVVNTRDWRRCAPVLFERESLCWDYPSSREKRQSLTRGVANGVGNADEGAGGVKSGRGRRAVFTCQLAHSMSNGLGVAAQDVLPTSDCNNSTAVMCRSDGQANAATEENLAPTLTSHNGKDASIIYPGRAKTLKIHGGCEGGGKGPLVQSDMSATLGTHNDQTLFTGQAGGLTVRRLTPMECERLQGFPDGWTDIPWKGKPHAPDSPRYKALGNSMAVPVMRWIGQGIQLVEDSKETMRDGQ